MRWILVALIAVLVCGCTQSGPSQAEKAELCLKNLQTLWVPLEFYMTDHDGQYPAQLEDLVKNASPATKKPYLDKVPECPPGWSYVYEVQPGTISQYTLMCRSNVVSPGLIPDYPRMTSLNKPISHP